MDRKSLQLRALVEPVITAMGYELVGVEWLSGSGLLRVYIDKEAGIAVEDCQQVSHQISGVLDVDDALAGRYTLEVSSPGMDRPLFEAEHYERFVGHTARLQLLLPVNGQRKFTGLLHGVQDFHVVLTVDGTEQRIPLDQIERARLVPEF